MTEFKVGSGLNNCHFIMTRSGILQCCSEVSCDLFRYVLRSDKFLCWPRRMYICNLSRFKKGAYTLQYTATYHVGFFTFRYLSLV